MMPAELVRRGPRAVSSRVREAALKDTYDAN